MEFMPEAHYRLRSRVDFGVKIELDFNGALIFESFEEIRKRANQRPHIGIGENSVISGRLSTKTRIGKNVRLVNKNKSNYGRRRRLFLHS
jgi:hypothetical protein